MLATLLSYVMAEEKFVFSTADDSVRTKDWAAGSSVRETTQEIVITDSGDVKVAAIDYAPAWEKSFDELLVNALDHYVRCMGTHEGHVVATASPVKEIAVTFDGTIKVFNNGPGIPTCIHRVASEHYGKDVRVPTLIFGYLFQGSNVKKSTASIIGGTNGIGAKIGIVHSVAATVETVDSDNFFRQTWTNHMKVAEEPLVIPRKDPRVAKMAEHTTVKIDIDYCDFGYPEPRADATTVAALTPFLRFRTALAAIYCDYTARIAGATPAARKALTCAVTFNGERRMFSTPAELASAIAPGCSVFNFTINPGDGAPVRPQASQNYPWEVAVAITSADIPARMISMVNGVVVRRGKHFQHIRGQITKHCMEKLGPVGNESRLKKNLFIAIFAKIPAARWDGQRKDEIKSIPDSLLKQYQVPAKVVDEIFRGVAPLFYDAKIRTKNVIEYDKYFPADSRVKHPWLVAAEGDSAISQLRAACKDSGILDQVSIISTGGVPVSARKHFTVIGGRVVPDETFAKNLFMKALITIIGLKYENKYDASTPEGRKEILGLNVRGIIMAVDTDHDGQGQILPLMVSTLCFYWPGLIASGFMYQSETPLYWVYPAGKGKVLSFYSERAFDDWAATADLSKYNKPKRCKGLATHSEDEARAMYKDFLGNKRQIYKDEFAEKYLDIYYGKVSDKRKVELQTPRYQLRDRDLEDMREHRIAITTLLLTSARDFQMDNIDRKLPSALDGFNQAGRKIVDLALDEFRKSKNRPVTVGVLSGAVTERRSYDHGPASLCDSIAYRAQIFCGGRQLPILSPDSMFGTRWGGGKDGGQARYVKCLLNFRLTDALLPSADYPLYDFHFDGDHRIEPRAFAPIIPPVYESHHLPGSGWATSIFARCVFDIIKKTRIVIARDNAKLPLAELKVCTYAGSPFEWRGTIGTVFGKPKSFGNYTISGADTPESPLVVRITELPIEVWTGSYSAWLKTKYLDPHTLIAQPPEDRSAGDTIDIRVVLIPGSIPRLSDMAVDAGYTDGRQGIDGVQMYLGLHKSLKTNINMTINDRVNHYERYVDVYPDWYPHRRRYYVLRHALLSAVLRVKIVVQEMIIRFIDEYPRLGLIGARRADMPEILTNAGFRSINRSVISRDSYHYDPTGRKTVDESVASIEERAYSTVPKPDFDYLLNIRAWDISAEKRIKSEEKVAKLRRELADLDDYGKFPGEKMWQRELNILEEVCREGLRTKWKFGDCDKYEY